MIRDLTIKLAVLIGTTAVCLWLTEGFRRFVRSRIVLLAVGIALLFTFIVDWTYILGVLGFPVDKLQGARHQAALVLFRILNLIVALYVVASGFRKEISRGLKDQAASKAVSITCYVAFLVIAIIAVDNLVLHKFLLLGYPRDYEQENFQRYPAPYVEFTGKPNVFDHNEFGFRGPSFKHARPDDLTIAFFGGSTGYVGNPPIAKIIEKTLETLLGHSVFVANYSVVSSNHRQHLHAIIEFLPKFRPDIVIFYGGYNETIQSAIYDPRPGYPYNFFYRSETSPFLKLLLENSATIGVIDQRTGIFTNLRKLRIEQRPLSADWDREIADKYFETLELANQVTGTIESVHFGRTKFFAFYQPYQVSKEFVSMHNQIKNRISNLRYAFDVSSEYDALGKDIYRDIVHVKQPANELMGAKIAAIVADELQKGGWGSWLWLSKNRPLDLRARENFTPSYPYPG